MYIEKYRKIFQSNTKLNLNLVQHIISILKGEKMHLSQDIKSYENLQNSLSLLKLIVQSENDIENNKIISQESMFANLEKKLFG